MATSEPEDPSPQGFIGVFGGTFDPVHNGHLRVALDAYEALGLSEIRLIPLAHAVHRDQPETPADLRLAMLKAAVRRRPMFKVDARELQREGASYTIDTLRELHEQMPDRPLCLLMGADAFNGFLGWHRVEAILDMASIAVMRRPDAPFAPGVRALFDQRQAKHLDRKLTGRIVDCPVAQLEISSSDIRRRLAAGRRIDYLVPDSVLEIIEHHGLYRDAPGCR